MFSFANNPFFSVTLHHLQIGADIFVHLHILSLFPSLISSLIAKQARLRWLREGWRTIWHPVDIYGFIDFRDIQLGLGIGKRGEFPVLSDEWFMILMNKALLQTQHVRVMHNFCSNTVDNFWRIQLFLCFRKIIKTYEQAVCIQCIQSHLASARC